MLMMGQAQATGDNGDEADCGDGECDEFGDVSCAAVLCFGRLDDLRYEDCVEHAACYEDVDEVG